MPRSWTVLWGKRGGSRLKRLVSSRRTSSARAETERDQEGVAARLESVERRLQHLEAMVEGLQDSVHRESVRQGKKIDQLERDADPSAIRRALGRDAREHGL